MQEIPKNNTRRTGFSRLIEIAGRKKWWLLGSMTLAVLSSLLQFVPYVAVYKIIIELAAHATDISGIDKQYIWHWGYISLISVAGYGVLFYASNMLSHIAAFNILYEMRVAVSQKLVRLPLGFFNKHASGEIKKIMSEDIERIELFVAHHIPDVTTSVVFPLLILIYMYVVDWRLALVITAVFLAAIVLQVMMQHNSEAKNRMGEYHSSLGQMNASIIEYVRGMQVVKIFNRSLEAFEKLRNDIFAYRDFALRVTDDFAFVYTGFLTILSSTLLFVVPVSVYLLIGADLYSEYISTVFLFLIIGAGMFFPMLKLMWMSNLLTQNSLGVGLIDEVLDKPEIENSTVSRDPDDASIEFKDVTFAYNENPVLNNVSFKAEPGTVTALVGPSGAGKSTIGMLTARFWDIDQGEILVGGVNIKEIDTEELMQHVAFVFQDNMLFFDTIEENIRMGNKGLAHEDVVRAAKAAQCHEFIEKLESGYETLVGEGGTYLSGGEQQRVALARAILKDAPIIVLDEATAYADPENEGKILESFAKLIAGKTVLVIAHRLSTVCEADQILVVDKGVIAENGKHDDLLRLNGVYAKMWNTYLQSRDWVINKNKTVQINLKG